jgi:TRAP-type C4-dicarboxylate transport system substrate-binding protein
MSSRTVKIGLLCVSAIALAACSDAGGRNEPSAGEAIDPITLTYSEIWPESSSGGGAMAAFMEYISTATDGAVSLEPYYQGALLTSTESLSGIGSGVADLGWIGSQIFPSELPELHWLSRAVNAVSAEHPHGSLEAYGAALQTYHESPELRAAFERNNIALLGVGASLPASYFCTTEVTSPADAAGKLAAVSGNLAREEAVAMGFEPVSLAALEIYEGLQRGVVDCVYSASAASFYPPFGIPEVAPYFGGVAGSSSMGGGTYGMNLDTWNRLSPRVQQIFFEATAVYMAEIAEGNVRDAASLAEDEAVTFVDVSEMNDTLREEHGSWRDALVTEAPESISDPEALLRAFTESLEQWKTTVGGLVLADSEGGGAGDLIRASYLDAPESTDWAAYTDRLRAIFAAQETTE